MRGSKGVVVGDGQNLEGASDVKQWPLKLWCEVRDKEHRGVYLPLPKRSQERDRKWFLPSS